MSHSFALAVFLVGTFMPVTGSCAASRASDSQRQPSCDFSKVQTVRFSRDRPAYLLSVRSVGRKCESVTIISNVSDVRGRTVWREGLRLTALERDEDHDSPARVQDIVRTWSTIENTGNAPPWEPTSIGPESTSTEDPTVYLTVLRRGDYAAIRNARAPMACVPIGPETGHCIAAVPRTGRMTVFLIRGV